MFIEYQMLCNKQLWLSECQFDLRLEFIEFKATSLHSIGNLELQKMAFELYSNSIYRCITQKVSVWISKVGTLWQCAVNVNGCDSQMISSASVLCCVVLLLMWPLHHHHHKTRSFWRKKNIIALTTFNN